MVVEVAGNATKSDNIEIQDALQRDNGVSDTESRVQPPRPSVKRFLCVFSFFLFVDFSSSRMWANRQTGRGDTWVAV